MGVPRRCAECAIPCDAAEVGVPKGDDPACCEEGGLGETPPLTRRFIGDKLGEGGGVGVTE